MKSGCRSRARRMISPACAAGAEPCGSCRLRLTCADWNPAVARPSSQVASRSKAPIAASGCASSNPAMRAIMRSHLPVERQRNAATGAGNRVILRRIVVVEALVVELVEEIVGIQLQDD